MSFSDMDRLEANYTKSSVNGIDQKGYKKDRSWKLQYAEPKDDNERLMIARVMVRQGGMSSRLDVLGIFMAIVSVVYLGIREVEWPSIVLVSLAIFGVFIVLSFISKKNLKQKTMITKVIAIDRNKQSHLRSPGGYYRHYTTYHLTVKQEETNMYADVEISEEMYDEYQTNRTVYLVKFGKTSVYAIYE